MPGTCLIINSAASHFQKQQSHDRGAQKWVSIYRVYGVAATSSISHCKNWGLLTLRLRFACKYCVFAMPVCTFARRHCYFLCGIWMPHAWLIMHSAATHNINWIYLLYFYGPGIELLVNIVCLQCQWGRPGGFWVRPGRSGCVTNKFWKTSASNCCGLTHNRLIIHTPI